MTTFKAHTDLVGATLAILDDGIDKSHERANPNAKHAKHSKPTDTPVCFITGRSAGFGLELNRQAIERGYRTVVTARYLAELPGMWRATRF